MSEPTRFGVVGAGWRAEFYLEVARACPERFEIVGVVARRPEVAERIRARYGVPTFVALDGLLAAAPRFVVTSVSREANSDLLRKLAAHDVPTLSETPPAPTLAELAGLADLAGARVQVAEQYAFQPHHAARLELARRGLLGQVWQAQISAAHGYHGVSLMRKYLGVGFEHATAHGHAFRAPIVAGPSRRGPPAREELTEERQELLIFDFGERVGVVDFSHQQYFSWIRGERVLVRGERGEIVNLRATYLQDYLTPLSVEFVRHAAGANGNLEGHYLKGIQAGEAWLYRNPFAPAPLTDEQIAVATALAKMASYVAGGEAFYPLAEACHDHYLWLVAQQALAQGAPARTAPQWWMP